MKTVFNKDNLGHYEGYPLFLGPDLGILDTINVNYPELEELYQKQLSQIWNEFEVDLTQDRVDMLSVPEETRELMVKTIMWQTAADSVASRSIMESLGEFITNTEMFNIGTIWSFFEVIHARTYSHIIKQTFVDPNEMIEKLYEDVDVENRLTVIKDVFDKMDEIKRSRDFTDEMTLKITILKVLTALFALEVIAFMASFAVTFAITETGVYQGIGQLVKLICRDELLHGRFTFEIFKILKNDPEWQEALLLSENSRKAILDSVVEQELNWSGQLFSEGRKVIGLNEQLLSEYVLYMATPAYDFFGFECDYGTVRTQPLPYMESYVDSSKVQSAAQEIQLTSYQVGTIADDSDDIYLDDFL